MHRTPAHTIGCGVVRLIKFKHFRKVAHFCIVNRWLSSQFTMLSAAVVGIVGLISVVTRLDASLSGFALSFAATITFDVSYLCYLSMASNC